MKSHICPSHYSINTILPLSGRCRSALKEEPLGRYSPDGGTRHKRICYCSSETMDDAETTPDSRNLSRKVVSVAAGEAHTLALTGDGRVYSWGRGMFGRLGTGSEADEAVPVRVKFDSSKEKGINFEGIAAGAYHSLALADDGSVWCWGYNTYGQLGIDGEKSIVPHMMERFLELGFQGSLTDEQEIESKTPLKVCAVKAGGMTSLAIDNHGALWMWGNCPLQSISSSEGGFSITSSLTPVPVHDFYGHIVVKVACGNEHVVALVSAGETYKGEDLVCYSWGSNNRGQLGLGDKESRIHPEIIQPFNQDSSWAVYEIACGAFHTALLTHKKRPNDKLESICWTFGLGENGQLGHGTTQSALFPEPVKELPQNAYLVSVDCGLFHTSVVSSAGDVWSWGMEKGLGLCPDASFTGTDAGDAVSPRLISGDGLHGPKYEGPVQVTCGAAHTVLVAQDGYKLWSWGRGRSGVLGNGKSIDCYIPTIVMWPPLADDFLQEELRTVSKEDRVPEKDFERLKVSERDSQVMEETDRRLSLATEEIKLLKSRLSIMERYATILHGSVFGRPFEEQDIPSSLRESGAFDVAKEWENMLESVDRNMLVRLEVFYRNILASVKDKIMKRRIQEIIKESLQSSTK